MEIKISGIETPELLDYKRRIKIERENFRFIDENSKKYQRSIIGYIRAAICLLSIIIAGIGVLTHNNFLVLGVFIASTIIVLLTMKVKVAPDTASLFGMRHVKGMVIDVLQADSYHGGEFRRLFCPVYEYEVSGQKLHYYLPYFSTEYPQIGTTVDMFYKIYSPFEISFSNDFSSKSQKSQKK